MGVFALLSRIRRKETISQRGAFVLSNDDADLLLEVSWLADCLCHNFVRRKFAKRAERFVSRRDGTGPEMRALASESRSRRIPLGVSCRQRRAFFGSYVSESCGTASIPVVRAVYVRRIQLAVCVLLQRYFNPTLIAFGRHKRTPGRLSATTAAAASAVGAGKPSTAGSPTKPNATGR